MHLLPHMPNLNTSDMISIDKHWQVLAPVKPQVTDREVTTYRNSYKSLESCKREQTAQSVPKNMAQNPSRTEDTRLIQYHKIPQYDTISEYRNKFI